MSSKPPKPDDYKREKPFKPAEPSLPLIASVHARMQPQGEPCRCDWCQRYRG